MPISLDVLIIVVSVVAAAFFAGAETALTAASRARMHALEMAGDSRAKLVTQLIGMRGRLISSMLLGGQFVTIGSSAMATSLMLDLYGENGVWAATGVMTAVIVVFGEVMPKTIAIAYPDRVSLLIAPAVLFFVTVFGPIVSTVETVVRGLLRLCGVSLIEKDPGVTGHEELMGAVDILHREGGVEREDRDMFGGLLELAEIPVSDIMVHRTKMHLRRPAAGRTGPRSYRVALYPHAAVPRRAGQHHRRPPRQGSVASLCRRRRRREQGQYRRSGGPALVHPGVDEPP
jgi:Mg2+/Co2+ transporter CorB